MGISISQVLQILDSTLRRVDYAATAGLRRNHRLPQSTVLMFHLVFKSTDDLTNEARLPFESFTVNDFAKLAEIYLELGYTFVAAKDLLVLDGPSICLTFDDGLANNARVLPILEQYSIPATFFISTNHICKNRAFWWDVIVRERRKQGTSRITMMKEFGYLRAFRHEQIDEYLIKEFGTDALRPVSEIERPFTPSELNDFAKHPLVEIGNHTAHHAILTNYSYDEAFAEIQQAQDTLNEITGKFPSSIAYPDGAYSTETVKAAAEAGLKIGLTTKPFPAQSTQPLEIGRYQFNALYNIAHQAATLNNTPYNNFRSSLIKRLQKPKA